MCLGVPGRVVSVTEWTAVVDFWGVRREVRLDIVDEPVQPGDYVLNHVGFAIRRIPAEDIEGTLAMYEDLIRQANETIYGLSAGIWTRDITRAHRFAKAVKAGVVWINTYNMFNAASPFGGYKQSGYGREMGKHALEMYTQVKSVWVDLSGKPIGWFGK